MKTPPSAGTIRFSRRQMGLLGFSAGLGLFIAEWILLTWRSSAPFTIVLTMLLTDVLVLTFVGLAASAVSIRFRKDTNGLIVMAVAAFAALPAVAGRVMFALRTMSDTLSPSTLWTITGLSALMISFAVGGGVAWVLADRLPRWTRNCVTWEVCAVTGAATGIFTKVGVLANKILIASTFSPKGLLTNTAIAIAFLLIIRALVSLCSRLPTGTTLTSLLVGTALSTFLPVTAMRSDTPTPLSAKELPNVILIVLDTTRADHLSLYGYDRKTSPHLEALAEKSTVYSHAISASTWTLPSHATLFTGEMPSRHGAHGRDVTDLSSGQPFSPLGRSIPTIANVLRSRGYATGACIANYGALASDVGLARGFNHYEANPRAVERIRPAFGLLISAFLPDDYASFIRPYPSAVEINRCAKAWLKKASSRPFFLFLNYMEAHHPYQSPSAYQRRFNPELHLFDDHRVPWSDYERLRRAVHRKRQLATESQAADLVDGYDAAIAYLDETVNNLLSWLDAHGVMDNAMLIITSDHGEMFGEFDLVGHGADPYEPAVWVPLLVHKPQQTHAHRVEATTSTREVFRLILAETRTELPTGHSLESSSNQPVISEVYVNLRRSNWGPRFNRVRRAIYNNRYKLIQSSDNENELFDLIDDRTESQNRFSDDIGVRDILASSLADWLTSDAGTPAENNPPSSNAIGTKTLQRLRTLGYLQ